MANTKQARKRARQAVGRRERNVAARSMLRTVIKKVRAAIETKHKDNASTAFKLAMPIIDSMARKGIVQKNAAARYKSRMNSHIKALA